MAKNKAKPVIEELKKVITHNAQVASENHARLGQAIQLNNLILNALIKKLGVSVAELEAVCEEIKAEVEAQEEQQLKKEEKTFDPKDINKAPDQPGEHPEEAFIFGG